MMTESGSPGYVIQGPEFVYWSNKKPRFIPLQKEISTTSPGRRRYVRVEAANGRKFDVQCNNNTKVQEIFDEVVHQLAVVEHFYFGLAWINENDEYYFLDQSCILQDVAPNEWVNGEVSSFNLLFIIKFYLRDEENMRNGTTKHLLYWQVRRDILADRLDCSEVNAIVFGAIALQCEYGDCTEEIVRSFKIRYYVTESVIYHFGENDLRKELATVYRNYAGYKRSHALNLLIREASKINDFGCFFYQLSPLPQQERDLCMVGISSSGILGFELDSDFYRETYFIYDWDQIKQLQLFPEQLQFQIDERKLGSNLKKGSPPDLSGLDQNLNLNLALESNYKAHYLAQFCNMLYKLHHALLVQNSRQETKRSFSLSIPSLWSVLDPNIFIDDSAKRVKLVANNYYATDATNSVDETPPVPLPRTRSKYNNQRTRENPVTSELKPPVEQEAYSSEYSPLESEYEIKEKPNNYHDTQDPTDPIPPREIVRKLVPQNDPPSSLGLFVSSTAVPGTRNKEKGIVVTDIDPRGEVAAFNDVNVGEEIKIGDRILAVNGSSLEGVTESRATVLLEKARFPVELILSQLAPENIVQPEPKLDVYNQPPVSAGNVSASSTIIRNRAKVAAREKDAETFSRSEKNLNSKSNVGTSRKKDNFPEHMGYRDSPTFEGFDYPPVTEEEKKNEMMRLWKRGEQNSSDFVNTNSYSLPFLASKQVSSEEDEVFMNRVGSPQSPTSYNHGDIFTVDLARINGGIGLVLCENEPRTGLFVRSLCASGAADIDGRIKTGDRIVKIHGTDVSDLTWDEAIHVLQQAPQVVRLEVQRWLLPINMYFKKTSIDYSFVTEESKFSVTLNKELSRGDRDVDCLGISFCGFVDVPSGNIEESVPRIKDVHFGGPAQRSGMVKIGDVLLAVDGKPIIEFDYPHIVDLVQRSSSSKVTLVLCRPSPGMLLPTQKCQTRRLSLEIVLKSSKKKKQNTGPVRIDLYKQENESLGVTFRTFSRDSEERKKNIIAVIKHIEPGSVAYKDGRLKVGDPIESMAFDSADATMNVGALLGPDSVNVMKLMQRSEGVLFLKVHKPDIDSNESFSNEPQQGRGNSRNRDMTQQASGYEYQKDMAMEEMNSYMNPYGAQMMTVNDISARKANEKQKVVNEGPIESPLFKIKGTTEYFDSKLLRNIKDSKNKVLSGEWKVEFEELNTERLTKLLAQKRYKAHESSTGNTNIAKYLRPLDTTIKATQICYQHLGTVDPALYLVSQSPSSGEVPNFLALIWHQGVQCIATFGGQRVCYWPNETGSEFTIQRFHLVCEEFEYSDRSEYRKISITNDNSRRTRTLHHFVFLAWDVNYITDLPTTTDTLKFVNIIRKMHAAGPLLVHCDDSISQSGVLVCIGIVLRLVELDRKVEIQHILRTLRQSLQNFVPHEELYKFLYMCFVALLETLHIF